MEITQQNNEFEIKKAKSNFLKRLVSKKKLRFENEYFDLDLSYITRRVIAMGYPSTGCESIYRNSLSEVLNFMGLYHKDVKVGNIFIYLFRYTIYVSRKIEYILKTDSLNIL